MDTSESALKFLVVVILTAIFLAIYIKRRYGPVGRKLIERIGPRWPLIIKVGSVATLILWLVFWVLVSPERRDELQKFYNETAPWVVR